MKKCPHCAEDVHDEAKVCKHCKSSLVEPTKGKKPKNKACLIIFIVLAALFVIPIVLSSLIFSGDRGADEATKMTNSVAKAVSDLEAFKRGEIKESDKMIDGMVSLSYELSQNYIKYDQKSTNAVNNLAQNSYAPVSDNDLALINSASKSAKDKATARNNQVMDLAKEFKTADIQRKNEIADMIAKILVEEKDDAINAYNVLYRK